MSLRRAYLDITDDWRGKRWERQREGHKYREGDAHGGQSGYKEGRGQAKKKKRKKKKRLEERKARGTSRAKGMSSIRAGRCFLCTC
jgi:hypothetical protein